jgi:hypothetical protein
MLLFPMSWAAAPPTATIKCLAGPQIVEQTHTPLVTRRFNLALIRILIGTYAGRCLSLEKQFLKFPFRLTLKNIGLKFLSSSSNSLKSESNNIFISLCQYLGLQYLFVLLKIV